MYDISHMLNIFLDRTLNYIYTETPESLQVTKHRHGHWTRHEHVDTCNVQNIERSTGVVSVSNTDTDACRTRDMAKS